MHVNYKYTSAHIHLIQLHCLKCCIGNKFFIKEYFAHGYVEHESADTCSFEWHGLILSPILKHHSGQFTLFLHTLESIQFYKNSMKHYTECFPKHNWNIIQQTVETFYWMFSQEQTVETCLPRKKYWNTFLRV